MTLPQKLSSYLIMVKRAKKLAEDKHAFQVDKQGEPYMYHIRRVVLRCNYNKFHVICAYLHDIVEDTDVTLDEIEKWFTKEVRIVVDALTRRKNESYEDYIERVSKDKNALPIKLYDLLDNMDLTRQKTLMSPKMVSRLNRYIKAFNRLTPWRETIT